MIEEIEMGSRNSELEYAVFLHPAGRMWAINGKAAGPRVLSGSLAVLRSENTEIFVFSREEDIGSRRSREDLIAEKTRKGFVPQGVSTLYDAIPGDSLTLVSSPEAMPMPL